MFCEVVIEGSSLHSSGMQNLIWLNSKWQSWTKTGYWFITTCDAIEWKCSYFRTLLHKGASVCSKIKQLCFMAVCIQAEWLGLQRDLCACIMPWALPVLNPCGISQLQPSVLGVRCAWKKQTTLLSFVTTAYFLPHFWKANELWAWLTSLPLHLIQHPSISTFSRQDAHTWHRKIWQWLLLLYLLNDLSALLMWNQLTRLAFLHLVWGT